MNKMVHEAKSIRNIEPKHFFIALNKKEIEKTEEDEYEDDQLKSVEFNQ